MATVLATGFFAGAASASSLSPSEPGLPLPERNGAFGITYVPGFLTLFFTGEPGALGATDCRAFSTASWNGVRPEMPLLTASGDTARGLGGPISLFGGGWLSIFASILGSAIRCSRAIGPIDAATPGAASPGGGFELGRFGGEAVTANGFTIDFGGAGGASVGMSMRSRFDGGCADGVTAGIASARRFAPDAPLLTAGAPVDGAAPDGAPPDAATFEDEGVGMTFGFGAPQDAQNFAEAFSSAPHFPHVIRPCYRGFLAGRAALRVLGFT